MKYLTVKEIVKLVQRPGLELPQKGLDRLLADLKRLEDEEQDVRLDLARPDRFEGW